MPVEAKKFVKLDKDWAKLMAKASETHLVLECCENEQLRTLLPVCTSLGDSHDRQAARTGPPASSVMFQGRNAS